MKNSIDDKIKNLSKEDRKKLNHAMVKALHDTDWCELNGINYPNPNMKQAKQILYEDDFKLEYSFPKATKT